MIAWRTAAAGVLGAALAVVLVRVYLGQREGAGREADREAPIVAPSRVRIEQGGPVVAIDSTEARRMGLRTVTLAPASAAPPLRFVASVVDEPERTATLRAPLSGRLAVADGSRWPGIGDRVSSGAPLAQISDARPLAPSLDGVVTAIGARPGDIVAEGQVLLEIVDRSRPVVRVVWEPEAGAPASQVLLEPPGGARRISASLIGPAAEADPLTRRPVYLYRASRGWAGGTPGTPLAALVPSGAPAARGALVPDDAVVQWNGLAWAYRRRGDGGFERIAVPVDRPIAGGWLAARGLQPGDTVVITGAQQLLSEEFRARISVGDESGE